MTQILTVDHPAHWLKVRNAAYSQWVGREKLFERERDPDLYLWGVCMVACEEA